MREILFKAKGIEDRNKGKWIEGIPFFSADKSRCVLIHALAVHPDFADDGNVYYSEGTPVDPQTVCQYTGFTDKKGVKIFEGDIVHYQYEPGKGFWNVDQNCIVSFRGAGFHIEGIMGTNKYACMSGWLSQLPIGNGDVFEVIGNIHDKEE